MQTGQLTIYYGPNPDMQLNYEFNQITIRDSKIYDFRGNPFPSAIFKNITFEPRCNEPQAYLAFTPPYTFVADPYWPTVSVYEHGGYKIQEISYFKLPQFDFWQNIQ